MTYRHFLRKRLLRWALKIEDPVGFPDDAPLDECWIWTGAKTAEQVYSTHTPVGPDKPMKLTVRRKAGGEPRARLFGDEVRPHRVMLGYTLGIEIEAVGKTANICGHKDCINPNHFLKVGEAQAKRAPVPNKPREIEQLPEADEQDRAFKLFWNASITVDMNPAQAFKVVPNRDWVDRFLLDYQSFIHGKLPAEVEQVIK